MPQTKPSLELVQRIYQKAVSDEEAVLQRWPYASEDKKVAVTELGFPPSSKELLRQYGNRDSNSAYSEEQSKRIAPTHRGVIKKHLPSLTKYRPSELVIASLQKCWELYAKLLLESANSLAGRNFGEIKPGLIESGFDPTILNFDSFQESQTRKYFLQQTPASIARQIVTQRHPKRVGSEEALRTAERHVYGRTRRGEKGSKKRGPHA